jgi:hypothetical protein
MGGSAGRKQVEATGGGGRGWKQPEQSGRKRVKAAEVGRRGWKWPAELSRKQVEGKGGGGNRWKRLAEEEAGGSGRSGRTCVEAAGVGESGWKWPVEEETGGSIWQVRNRVEGRATGGASAVALAVGVSQWQLVGMGRRGCALCRG